MLTYAVVWSENGGPAVVGSLEFAGDDLVLSGATAGTPASSRRLPLATVSDAHLGRFAEARGGLGRGLVVLDADGGRVEIASLEGAGALHEVADHLAALRKVAVP